MEIRFTNYKKVYIILGVFVLLLGFLYIISVQAKRNRDNANKTGKAGSGAIDIQTATEKQFLTEKTNFIINSLAYDSLDYRDDPVFQNENSVLLGRMTSEVKRYQLPINIEIVTFRMDTGGLYGRTYIRINGSTNVKSYLIEIAYQKNNKGEWKLANFIIHKPL
jgi:uncharacterized protein YpmS